MGATENQFHSQQPTVDVDAEDVETSSKKRRARKHRRVLITDAQRSPELNRRTREKQYIFLQGIRMPLLLLSMVSAFAWNNWWLASVLFVVSVPLPWLSVMVANGQGEKRDSRQRNVYKPAVIREEQRLEAARRAELEAGTSGSDGSAGEPGEPGELSIIEHEEKPE